MNGNRRWLGWAAIGLGAWLLLGGIFGRGGWHSEREVFGGPGRGRGGFTQQDGGYQQGYQDGLNDTRQGGGNTGGNATGGSYQQGYQEGYQDGLNASQGRGGREQVRGGDWSPGWDDERRHGHGFFFPLLLLPLLLGGFLLLRRRGGPPWMGGHRCREHQGQHSQPATQQAPAQAPAAPAPQPASDEQDPPGPATGATRQL